MEVPQTKDYSYDDLKPEQPKDSLMESDHHHEKFNMREVVLSIPGVAEIRFNPFVSLIATVLLWGLAVWCIVDPDSASSTLIDWRSGVADLFTWFYIGTNPAFMVRLLSFQRPKPILFHGWSSPSLPLWLLVLHDLSSLSFPKYQTWT